MNDINIKIAELRKQFRTFYKKNLNEKFYVLDEKRRIYLHLFYIVALAFLTGLCIWCCLCLNGYISSSFYTSKMAVNLYLAYFGLALLCCRFVVNKFKRETKALVMDKILSFWGNFQYSGSTDISRRLVQKSKLFRNFDKQEIDDNFRGRYNNADINVSEQKLYEIIRTSKGSRKEKVFSGVLILLKFNKFLTGQTVVLGKKRAWKTLDFSFFASIGLILYVMLMSIYSLFQHYRSLAADEEFSFAKPESIMILVCLVFIYLRFRKQNKTNAITLPEEVYLEDIRFNSHWQILADDQVEARYILTTAFMECLQELRRIFTDSKVDCSFFDNTLLIAVHSTKDWFETTSLFKSTLKYRKVEEVLFQFHSIFSVIDVLKLAPDQQPKPETKKQPLE